MKKNAFGLFVCCCLEVGSLFIISLFLSRNICSNAFVFAKTVNVAEETNYFIYGFFCVVIKNKSFCNHPHFFICSL